MVFSSYAKLVSLLVNGYFEVRNLVNFDPANFDMTKICQSNFQSLCRLARLFLDTSAVILQKGAKSLEKFFSSSENAIWLILLKYQEIGFAIADIH